MARQQTLSVVMTTYNGEQYLQQQLDSLSAQDSLPDEVVMGDDCSTDATADILQRWARSAPFPVRLHRNEVNLGWRANFMATASRSEGQLVAFCDQDDVWRADKLSRMRTAMATPGVVMAFHNARLIDGEGRPLGSLSGGPTGRETLVPPLSADIWAPVLGFSMVVRRELFDLDPLWPRSVDKLDLGKNAAHDQWFQFWASVLGQTVVVDEELVDYRLHETNNMGYRHSRLTAADFWHAWQQSHRKALDRAGVAANRSALLEAALSEHPQWRRELSSGLEAYREHLRTSQSRLRLYDARLPERIAVFAELVRNGTYRSPTLPMGRKELVRDVLATVLGRAGQPEAAPEQPETVARADVSRRL